MLGKLGGIKRRLTERIVDAAFLIKSPANLAKAVVILHGASSTGKSYALRWLNRRYKGCVCIEMDRFMYNRVLPDPGILKTALDLLTDAGVAINQAQALVQKIENANLLWGKYPMDAGCPGKMLMLLAELKRYWSHRDLSAMADLTSA